MAPVSQATSLGVEIGRVDFMHSESFLVGPAEMDWEVASDPKKPSSDSSWEVQITSSRICIGHSPFVVILKVTVLLSKGKGRK